MKTVDDFKKAAKQHGVFKIVWTIRDCTMCGYPLSYIVRNDRVFFDSGCDCMSQRCEPKERSWEELAEYYNMQTYKDTIVGMDKFWGFKSDETIEIKKSEYDELLKDRELLYALEVVLLK